MENKVTVYSTPTCPYCIKAKDYLTEKGIEFTSIDVGKDRDALAKMIELTGGVRSVPVLVVCNEVMVGFDKGRLDQALNCLDQSTEI